MSSPHTTSYTVSYLLLHEQLHIWMKYLSLIYHFMDFVCAVYTVSQTCVLLFPFCFM
jgi:hypothetical protein